LLLWEGNIFLSTIFLSLGTSALAPQQLCGFLSAKFCFALRRFLLDWMLHFRPDEGASFLSVGDVLCRGSHARRERAAEFCVGAG
jgi:hypothetical protein